MLVSYFCSRYKQQRSVDHKDIVNPDIAVVETRSNTLFVDLPHLISSANINNVNWAFLVQWFPVQTNDSLLWPLSTISWCLLTLERYLSLLKASHAHHMLYRNIDSGYHAAAAVATWTASITTRQRADLIELEEVYIIVGTVRRSIILRVISLPNLT